MPVVHPQPTPRLFSRLRVWANLSESAMQGGRARQRPAARCGSSSARRCRRSDGGGRRRSVPAPFVCAEALRPTLRRGAKTTGACCCEMRLVQQYNQRDSEDKIELPSRIGSSLHTMISRRYDTSTMADDNPALGSQGGAISVRISLNRRTD